MIDCIIPARLESTRFPSKVLAEVKGKSVLQHCVDNANSAKDIRRVWIASNCVSLLDPEGGLLTGDHHETCTSRVSQAAWDVKADYIVNLQSDEPCVTGDMIDDMIKYMFQKNARVVQCCYPLTDEERGNINVVKAVISNGKIIYLTRTPDRELMHSPNLVGINGLYCYDISTIRSFNSYDQELTTRHKGLDTLAFIGIVDVYPFMIEERTPAVDIPSDIELVEKYLDIHPQ